MDGNIYETTTNNAYQTCSECRKGIVGRCWQWTEWTRIYFCCVEHAQDFAHRGGFAPRGLEDDETAQAAEANNGTEETKPGRIKSFFKRLVSDD